MEMTEKITLCKQCLNRGFNPSEGIVCSLTNAKPNFDTACKDFLRDESISVRSISERRMSEKANRGGCLTAFLVLIIIGALFNILSSLAIIAMRPPSIINYIPLHLYFISLLSGGLALASAIMMFQWKKVGVYLYGGGILINVLTQIQMPRFESIQLVGIIIGVVIIFAVIAPKWDHFK